MESVYVTPMTKESARQFYREFVLDPDLFADKSKYQPFLYSDNFIDTRVERYARMGRIYMAVMLDQKPIGEIVLKNIDLEQRSCEMGISMINELEMQTVCILQMRSSRMTPNPCSCEYYIINPLRTQQNFYFVAFVSGNDLVSRFNPLYRIIADTEQKPPQNEVVFSYGIKIVRSILTTESFASPSSL